MSEKEMFGQEDDEEVLPTRPKLAELLKSRPEIIQNIKTAVAETQADGKERGFQASINDVLEVNVTSPIIGEEDSVSAHLPALGEETTHPEGLGFHLPQGYFPFFLFHTHPQVEPKGDFFSHADLFLCLDYAKQNLNLAPSESPHWINLISVIGLKDKLMVIQYAPKTVETLPVGNFDDWFGKGCIEVAKKHQLPEYLAEVEEERPGFYEANPNFILLHGDENGEPVKEVPSFIEPYIEEVYNYLGITYKEIDLDQDLAAQFSDLEIAPEFGV